jgi:hypothetical protein
MERDVAELIIEYLDDSGVPWTELLKELLKENSLIFSCLLLSLCIITTIL